MAGLTVADVMSREVVWTAPERPLAELGAAMAEGRLSCLVVAAGDRPVGIVSERDLVRVLAEILAGGRADRTAADLMSAPLLCLRGEVPVEEAATVLGRHGYRRAPVVDAGGRLVGLITQTDLLVAHRRALARHAARLEAEVAARTRELRLANEQLERLALEDALLGIGNRRAMGAHLDHLEALWRRHRRPFAVALFDVDRFKAYNDRYGHPAGDRVLRRVADEARQSLRGSDRLFRYGGEEILACLPETGLDGARTVAERVRGRIEAAGLEHAGSECGVVTVSGGVAARDRTPASPEAGIRELLARADAALYRAKEAGRNRIAVEEGTSA